MSSHTPGPWRVGDAGQTVFGPKTDQPAPVTIATLSGATARVPSGERAANARLIAAAPGLLAVMQSAADELDTIPFIHRHDGINKPLAALRAAIKAAS